MILAPLLRQLAAQQMAASGIVLGAEQTFVVGTGTNTNATVEQNRGSGAATPNDNILTSDDLEMGALNDYDAVCGVRFPAVNVPKFSSTPDIGKIGELTEVSIQFQAKQTNAYAADVTVDVYGIDEDNTGVFTTTVNDLESRGDTTAKLTWTWTSGQTEGDKGADQKTPELKTIVQEILERAGWSSGNAMGFKFKNMDGEGGGSQGGTTVRNMASSSHATYDPPELTIKYKVWEASAGSGTGDPIIDLLGDDLVLYIDTADIPEADGALVAANLVDKSSQGIDLTPNDEAAGPGTAQAHVATFDSYKEIKHPTADGWFVDEANDPDIDFDPSTDSMAMIVVLGEDKSTNTNEFILHKGSNGSSVTQSQFGMRITNSADQYKSQYGGVEASNSGILTLTVPVLIANMTPSLIQNYTNGAAGNSIAPGTYTHANPTRVGSRGAANNTSGSLEFTGSWRKIALVKRTLTTDEILEIVFHNVGKGANLNPDIDFTIAQPGGWNDQYGVATTVVDGVLQFTAEGSISSTANNWAIYSHDTQTWGTDTGDFVLSYEARTINGSTDTIQIGRDYSVKVTQQVTSEWKTYYHTLRAMTPNTSNRISIGANGTTGQFQMRNLKLHRVDGT